MTRKEVVALTEVQDLVGESINIYQNDRSSMRADNLVPRLQKAFNRLIELLGKYPPVAEAERKQQ